jgi:CO/xanthine dehydrogenase FAD-binding subunit
MNDRQGSEAWAVDADATLQVVLDDPGCPPLLSRVLKTIHSWQIRNETSVRRTLTVSQLMPQWVAALLALGAFVTIEGEDGTEDVELEILIRRQVTGEIATLHVPSQDDACWGEARVARTPSDDPIVAAYAVVKPHNGLVEEARIALTGASSRPVWLADASNALLDRPLNEEAIEDVVAAIEDGAQPQGDYLGSAAYRRAMALVLTRRALEACAASSTTGGNR